MPRHGIVPVAHQEVLTFEEILRLVRIFAGLGIKKIRLTGGEPLVRKDATDLIACLWRVKGIEEVSLTTNGILLADYAGCLKKAGIKRINISLDTLSEDKFKAITGADAFYQVMKGIDKAIALGFSPLKLNTVAMKGINDDEIIDFVNFSLSRGLVLRFIEFMKVTPLWREDYFIPIEEVKGICSMEFDLEKIEYPGNGPAQYYKAGSGIIGFIKTEEFNCRQCNRLRLTSTGELKLCLYETDGFSLRDFLRNGSCEQEIKESIEFNLGIKEKIDYRNWESCRVYMSDVGG